VTDYSAELGHVELEVRDLDRAAAFYRRVLRLGVTERMDSRKGRVVFLSAGSRHHDLALTAAPGRVAGAEATGDGDGPGAGFQLAFEVPDREAFADTYFRLRADGVPATAVDHGISWSLYFRDPDDHTLEVYWDTRDREQGRDRWEGASRLLALDDVLDEGQLRRLGEMRAEAEAEAARDAGEDGDVDAAPDRSGTED